MDNLLLPGPNGPQTRRDRRPHRSGSEARPAGGPLLVLVLSWMIAVVGCSEKSPADGPIALWEHGGIVRGDTTRPELALVFTGDSFAEGMDTVRSILASKQVPASFFFTGNFYRNLDFEAGIRGLLADGHYLGAHSDRHLLYCDWTNRDSLLVTREEFEHYCLTPARTMRALTREQMSIMDPEYKPQLAPVECVL